MAQTDILSTGGSQLRVGYDGSHYLEISVDSNGDATITPTGGDITLAGKVNVSGAFFAADGIAFARNTFRETTTLTVSGLASLTGAAWRYAMLELSCVGGTTSAATPFVSKYLVRLEGITTWAIGTSTLVSGSTLTITNVSGDASSVTLTITTRSLADSSLSVMAHGWGSGTTLAFS